MSIDCRLRTGTLRPFAGQTGWWGCRQTRSEGRNHRRRNVRAVYGGQAAGRRHRLLHDLREGRRGRRHLARQHLSRADVRRPVALLLVFVPAEPGLVATDAAGAGDPRYFRQVATERGMRRTSGSAPTSTSARYRDGQWWVTHRRRRGSVGRADHRDGLPSSAALPGHRRASRRSPERSFIPRAGIIRFRCRTSGSG